MTMFTLKNYQENTLRVMRQYLEAARYGNPKSAFEEYLRSRDGGLRREYGPVDGLEDAPYFCLRLPTGGGKTLLAAHSIRVCGESFLEREYPLVLWLVPTNTIRSQTLETLRTAGHSNWEVLNEAFQGRFEIFDIADFVQIRPSDLREKVCVVIGTIATLRVEETEGRKVYAHNENLAPHFSMIPQNFENLERVEEGADKGKIKNSFRNLLAVHRPLVIVDEAHNASTSLSFDVLKRIRPACIIEFTATPAVNSNVLHSVSAAELKAEAMIKLPIILTEHQTWQDAVHDSLLTRKKLEGLAKKEKDYIKPIILIQAESRDKEVTFEVIEKYLVEQEHVGREKIAIVTGEKRELEGINLLDSNCPIEIVITVKALAEGWDCPFAYVFCSVATVHSKRDVEQLLGRVLRMPYARKREQEELNKAYAHVSSESWPYAVKQLHDRLVDMGFDQQEANQFIQPQYKLPLFGGAEQTPVYEPFVMTADKMPDLGALPGTEREQIHVEKLEDGKVKVAVSGQVSQELEKCLLSSVPQHERSYLKQNIGFHRQRIEKEGSPAQKGEKMAVPRLCVEVQGELELAEKEWFLDARGWKLLDFPAELSEEEFSIQEKANSWEIDVKGKRLQERFLGTVTLFDVNTLKSNWDILQLSRWMDVRLYQPDVRQEVLLEYLRRVIDFLISKRKVSLEALVRVRYPLENALQEKIASLRQTAYEKGYQEVLFGPGSAVQTSYKYAFSFDPANYPAHEFYNGSYKFSKHFYAAVGDLQPEGEEFECAQAIDRNPLVKHWVRNLERQSDYSFWLPTATDLFYPDFVAELEDGRILVVEYKGGHLVGGPDAQEKLNIGQLWEAKSGGKGLFLMTTKVDDKKRDVYRQIEDKIS